MKAFPAARVGNGFGLTETSSVTSYLPHEYAAGHADSVGFPVPVCDVRIETFGGQDVGELLVRGPNVVAGYWNNPDATAAMFTGGWLHTGDLARIDAEGLIYIVDRRQGHDQPRRRERLLRRGRECPGRRARGVRGGRGRRARRGDGREGRRGARACTRRHDRRRAQCWPTCASGSPTSRCRSTSSCGPTSCPAMPAGSCSSAGSATRPAGTHRFASARPHVPGRTCPGSPAPAFTCSAAEFCTKS